MYGAVDMLVVGQFCHAGEVSAVSHRQLDDADGHLFYPGLTMGTTVLLGNRIGAGKAQDGGRVVGVSILLFLAIGTVLTLVLELLAVPFARMMQAPQEALTAPCCISGSVARELFLSSPSTYWAASSGGLATQSSR